MALSVFIRFIRFIRVPLLFCITTSALASINAIDDLGRRVELKQPAQRIVALAPFLTELAFSTGLGAKLVGASAYSDYPPKARELPQVASAAGIALEPLLALHPDLVLAWADTIRDEEVKRLEGFGIAVFVARARHLDDVPRLLEALSRLGGTDASPAARNYRARIFALARAHEGRPAVPAFVEIWSQPLTTIGAGHWIDEALAACGARNAFADLPGVAPQVDWELVYQRDPRVVVGMGTTAAQEVEFRRRWGERGTLSAVRENRLVFVDADLLQRPSLRLADGVASLCAGIDRLR